MPIEAVVQVVQGSRVLTFRPERDAAFGFWRVESEGQSVPLPLRVLGTEQPDFFRSTAALVSHHFDR